MLKKYAFTLVELLVVIGIIGILAGMLLPTLAAARKKAQTTTCINNMKQVGTALMMYTGDNKNATTEMVDSDNIYYPAKLNKYVGANIWSCSAVEDDKYFLYKEDGTAAGTSDTPFFKVNYVMNATHNSETVYFSTGVKITSFKSSTAIFACENNKNNNPNFAATYNTDKNKTFDLFTLTLAGGSATEPDAVHDTNKTNFLYSDNHVSTLGQVTMRDLYFKY